METLLTFIDDLALRGPRAVMLTFTREGREKATYAQLAANINGLAAGLQHQGVRPPETVGIMAANQYAWVVACLAVIKTGAAVVPIDVQVTDHDLAYILRDSRIGHIFTTTDQVERLKSHGDAQLKMFLLDVPESDERSWQRLCGQGGFSPCRVNPQDQAILFYTSGTTGHPKGVGLTHANILFQLKAMREEKLVREGDHVLLPLPFHHVYPLVIGLLATLSLGLMVVLPYGLTGPQIIRAIKEARVTVMCGVPRLYRALVEGIESNLKALPKPARLLVKLLLQVSLRMRCSTNIRVGKVLLFFIHRKFGGRIRIMACGGSALPETLHAKLEALGWPVAIGYGLTETAPILTLNRPRSSRIGSAGKPLAGVELRLENNEILAKGPNIFGGYRHLDEETKKVFTPDGWFKTGDLGYFDQDGYLFISGRASTLIVTESGKNIQPEDVEEFYVQNPVISEVGILQKDNKLVAVIVPDLEYCRRENKEIGLAVREAVTFTTHELPTYKRIVDYAVTRDPLPRTRLGKIRRHLLAEIYDRQKQGQGGSGSSGSGPVAIEKMTPDDQRIFQDPAARKLWEWLSEKYARFPLTPDTSPQLDLGIDSLEWINLTLEIRQRVGVELDEEAISRIETVRDLVREATQGTGPETGTAPKAHLENPDGALTDEQRRWLDPLPAFARPFAYLLWGFVWLIMKIFFRHHAEGVENLPVDGPYIITPNHTSFLDPFVVGAALPYARMRRMFWAGWTGILFANAAVKVFSRLAQVIPIDAERAAMSSLSFAAAVLKRGKNLVWFPEGARSPSGELMPLRGGMGILLNHFKVPVVPAIIYGAHEAWPTKKAFPRAFPVRIVFGKPILPEEIAVCGQTQEPAQAIMQLLHARLEQLQRAHRPYDI